MRYIISRNNPNKLKQVKKGLKRGGLTQPRGMSCPEWVYPPHLSLQYIPIPINPVWVLMDVFQTQELGLSQELKVHVRLRKGMSSLAASARMFDWHMAAVPYASTRWHRLLPLSTASVPSVKGNAVVQWATFGAAWSFRQSFKGALDPARQGCPTLPISGLVGPSHPTSFNNYIFLFFLAKRQLQSGTATV